MEDETIYFDQPGSENTDDVLEIIKDKAESLGIKTVVIASTSGETALKAQEKFGSQLNIIAVGTYKNRSDPEKIKEFRNKAGKYFYAFDDLDYDYATSLQNKLRQEIGEGAKVALEVVIAATLAGLIKKGEKVIGVGGAYPGADTAFVVEADNEFDQSKIKQVVCCPK